MLRTSSQPYLPRAESSWFVSLWWRWIAANAIGELLGLGLVAATGAMLVMKFGEAKSVIVVLLMAATMILLGIGEGLIVGLAQWLVLRRFLPAVRASAWITATAFGAFTAWLLGMLPSTLMNLSESAEAAPPPEISDALRFGLVAVMGLALGVILALPQWRVLRHQISKAGWGIAANAIAWAVGMPVIFLGAGALPGGVQVMPLILFVALTLLVAGAIVGAIHGFALIWLLSQQDLTGDDFSLDRA